MNSAKDVLEGESSYAAAMPAERSGATESQAAIQQALKKSRAVKQKVEHCADQLGASNDEVKKKIAAGATELPAQQLLADSEHVEGKVQECVGDLHEVNDSLVLGIADLKQVEAALKLSRQQLAAAKADLEIARAEEQKARLRALHDATTGLPNRHLFDDRLAHAISVAERHDWNLAVMFLDLDGFKSINDSHGHAAGDEVLKQIASRLARQSREEDTACRNGGDEFLLLLMNPKGKTNIVRIAKSVRLGIAEPIQFAGLTLAIKSSIGIAVYPADGTSGEQLIRNADAAMYRAKKSSSGYVFC